ncbi:hypothetical protein EG68_07288 [Paragonimus skrjabini miyazakii]|uniref:Peptidase M60 domain-containing protein n=1 Tax=Paragonimus skrjabini miyazakii TaxID=59628 RepID=A0A8S9YXU2_9TREM|nr:hypothetical protein EG68_07288 [Paragonimus skrjabini miyazakii]
MPSQILFNLHQAKGVNGTQTEENVAYQKSVHGDGYLMQHLVDGDLETNIAPKSTGNLPIFFVDLDGLYNLTSIRLHAQTYALENGAGLNVPFSLYIWANYTPRCDMYLHYPWKLIKSGLVFMRNREEIVIRASVSTQYIIIMMDDYEKFMGKQIVRMSEIRAFGSKIKDGYVPAEPSEGSINIPSNLRTLKEKVEFGARSWTYFKYHLNLTGYELEDYHTDEIQQAIRQVINNYGEYFAHHAPCDWHNYILSNRTFLAMLNYNKLLLAQSGAQVTRMPGYSRILGDVHQDARPTSYCVVLNVTQAGNCFPVGAYAKAGETFHYKVRRLSSNEPSEFRIRVNPQTDYVSERTEFRRWPLVTAAKLLKLEDNFSTPVGGVITLTIPENSTIKICFRNVYRYPWFDIRNPRSIDTWEEQQIRYPHVPFTMVMGDRLITMLETSSFLKMNKEDMLFSVNYYDNAIKMMHNYRGTDFASDSFMGFVIDEQLAFYWGHSGHMGQTMMGHKDWEPFFRNLSLIKSGKAIYINHEIGHKMQLTDITLMNGGDVTNELYIPLVQKHLLNIPAYNIGVYPGLSYSEIHQLVNNWKDRTYRGVQLSYYNLLGHYFGEGLVGNVLSKKVADGMGLESEADKIHYWVKAVSFESGYNLVPFHRLWQFPMNQSTVNATQHLPCFFPNDALTSQVTELVEEILNEYGSDCARNDSATVEFKGNLYRGINITGTQFIFFHPYKL